jgi:hypothetical protein
MRAKELTVKNIVGDNEAVKPFLKQILIALQGKTGFPLLKMWKYVLNNNPLITYTCYGDLECRGCYSSDANSNL